MVGGFTPYACYLISALLTLQGLMCAVAPVRFFKSNPVGSVAKILGPYFEEIVKADPAILLGEAKITYSKVDGKVYKSLDAPSKKQLSTALLSVLVHVMRLFGVFSITVAGLGMYLAISGGILASAFVAMFLLTFIGFQVVHIFQPFPGEKPSEPYAGIAVFTVIFGGLLVADALYT